MNLGLEVFFPRQFIVILKKKVYKPRLKIKVLGEGGIICPEKQRNTHANVLSKITEYKILKLQLNVFCFNKYINEKKMNSSKIKLSE